MSQATLKADAARLADHLRSKYGWNMKTAGALEALAISRGFSDWNTCVAALGSLGQQSTESTGRLGATAGDSHTPNGSRRSSAFVEAWGTVILTGNAGLYLMAGKTGSGKTTSAKVLITQAIARGKTVASIFQTFGPGWALAVDSNSECLRFDGITSLKIAIRKAQALCVDMIFVNELRAAPGMAKVVLDAADEGELILATIFAPHVRGAIDNLVSMANGDLDQVFRLLKGVRVQELMPRVPEHPLRGMEVRTEEVLFSEPDDVHHAFNGDVWWTSMMSLTR